MTLWLRGPARGVKGVLASWGEGEQTGREHGLGQAASVRALTGAAAGRSSGAPTGRRGHEPCFAMSGGSQDRWCFLSLL